MNLRSVVLVFGVFAASAVQNALSAFYLTTANKRFFARAATIGVVMTAVNLLCWQTLLSEDMLHSNAPSLVAYLLGDWIGSFVGLKRGSGPPPVSPSPPCR